MSADIDRIVFAAREYRRVSREDATVKSRHPNSTELNYFTYLTEEADAEAFGDYVLELLKHDRFNWTLRIKRRGLDQTFTLGDTIRIFYPRFGLENGGDFIVKRIRLDTAQLFMDVSLYGPSPVVGAASFSLYLDPDTQSYWVGGTQYGGDYGAELASNNQFDSGYAPWSPMKFDGTAGTTQLSNTGGKLRLTNVDGGFQGGILALPTVAGRRYRLEIETGNAIGGFGGVANVGVSSNPGYVSANLLNGTLIVTSTSPQTHSYTFLASSSTSYLTLITNSGTIGDWVEFESVSAREMIGPYSLPGYSFTRTGEQGEVSNPEYEEMIGDPELTVSSGWTLPGATISEGIMTTSVGGGARASYGLAPFPLGPSFILEIDVIATGNSVPYVAVGNGILGYSAVHYLAAGKNVVNFSSQYDHSSSLAALAINHDNGGGTVGATISRISLRKVLPVVEWFPTNIPAITNRGAHIYGAITNRLPYSTALGNWISFGGATKGATNKLAPDGSYTAVEVNLPAGSPQVNQFYMNYSGMTTGWKTFGMFVRSRTGGNQRFTLKVMNPADIFSPDLIATPEWNFFAFPYNFTSPGQNSSISNSRDGTAASLEVWQGQIIDGYFPDGGPLIRNTGNATANIGASNLDLGYDLIDEDELIWVEADIGSPEAGTSPYDWLASFNANGTSGTRIDFFRDLGISNMTVHVEGTASTDLNLPFTGFGKVKLAVRRQAGKFKSYLVNNGALTESAESAEMAFPAGLNKLEFSYPSNDGHNPDSVIEGTFVKKGSFTDEQVRELLIPSPTDYVLLGVDPSASLYRVSHVDYDAISSLPGYVFTRTGEQGAIDSTGFVQWFATNVPAINDRGYHVYGALTNFLFDSQDISTASWGKGADGTGVTPVVTANAALAPDGTMTADRVQLDRGSSADYGNTSTIGQPFAGGPVAGTHTLSYWLKSATGATQQTYVNAYHPSIGAVMSQLVTITPDWQRFTFV